MYLQIAHDGYWEPIYGLGFYLCVQMHSWPKTDQSEQGILLPYMPADILALAN